VTCHFFQGFEARGTSISNRLNAYDLLLAETVTDPSTLHVNDDLSWHRNFVLQNTTQAHGSDGETDDTIDDALREPEMSLLADNYFCDIPS